MTIDPAAIAPIVELAGQLIPSIASYTNTLTSVLIDPALPQVLGQIGTVINNHEAANPGTGVTSNGVTYGVGLSDLVAPLDLVITVQGHPWIPWVAGAAVLILPFLIGMGVGERRAKRKARGASSSARALPP